MPFSRNANGVPERRAMGSRDDTPAARETT